MHRDTDMGYGFLLDSGIEWSFVVGLLYTAYLDSRGPESYFNVINAVLRTRTWSYIKIVFAVPGMKI